MYLIKIFILSVFLVLSFTMSGCQGNNSDAPGSTPEVLQGTFVDAPVQGLSYKTPTQSGFTDANGQFKYLAGETVEFRLGNLLLGSTTAGTLVTPRTLSTDSTKAVNIALLLQNFDNRLNPNLINVLALKDYDFSDFNLSASNADMESNVTALLSNLDFKATRGGTDFTELNATTVTTSMDDAITVYENSNPDPTPVPLPDQNATSNINSLALSINSNQEVLLDTPNNRQNVIVVDNTPVSITIKAFDVDNKSATDGTIGVSYPRSSADGKPVNYLGSMSPDSFAISQGGEATFIYTPPSNIDSLKASGLTGAEFVFYDIADPSKKVSFFVKFTDPKYATYTLSAFPDANVTIREAGQTAVLEAYLEDNNSLPVSGEDVIVEFFDASKGTLSSFSATTDANGHVAFNYTAPADITIADMNVTMKLRGDITNSDYVTIDFDTTPPAEIDYTTYSLTTVPTAVTLTEASQTKVIDLYLEDNNSRPVVNETILLDFFDGSKGTASSFSATTDANGHVAFEYTAPATVADGLLTTLTFRGANSTLNTATTTVTVNTNVVPDPKYATYKQLKAYPDANVTIREAGQTAVLEAYLEDNNSLPVSGEDVIVEFFDVSKGSLSSFSATTNADGQVVFNYTAPADITIADMNVTMKLRGDITNSDYVTIDFDTTVITDPKYNNYEIVPVISSNIIRVGSQEKVIDVYVKTNEGKLAAGERILVDFFDGTNGRMQAFSSITDENGHAIFNYTSPLTVKEGEDYNVTFRLENNYGINDTVTFTVGSSTGGTDYSDYNLTSLTPNININQASQEVTIDLYLEDMNKRPAEGELILLDFFDGNTGSMLQGVDNPDLSETLSGFSDITDPNGHVVFRYVAPVDISDLNGTVITFKLDNNTSIKRDFTILVNINDEPDYSSYTLTAVPTAVRVTEASQTKVIDLYLEDNNSRPVVNETILLDFFDGSKGTASSFSATTDANGHVVFEYTAPATVVDGNVSTLTFRGENSTLNTATTTVTVDTTVVTDPKYATYSLSAFPDTNVTITEAGQSAVLEGYLADSNNNNLPVSGEEVIVEFFDVSKGTLSSFSATTDANGHVAFNYTAPADISTVADMNITMKLSGDVTKKDNVEVFFDTTAPVKDYSAYTISLVDVNRTITQRFQVEVFNVYLEDNSSGVAKAAVGDTIVVDYFDGNSGTLNSFSALTDANGRAQFTYTAPNDLNDLNGTKITFRVQNTTATANFVESTLTVSADSSLLAKLQMSKSTLDIVRDAQAESITVLAFNAQGEAYSGGFVTLRYPTEITNNGVSGGTFTQSSVELVNGQAVFNFEGPDPLESQTSLNFDFIYSEDSDINTTLTVNYIPETPKIVVDDGNITITKNGEIRTINLSVFSQDRSLYPDGNIGIKYPEEALTGKNVGKFDTLSSPVVDGKASFVYTAPNPLDGNDTIGFTFYHDAQPILSEKDFNITIVPEVGQIVLTNYVLDATYDTSMNLETTKGMTFYIKDENGDLISDSNVTSMRITSLNTALGSLEDTSGNTGTTLRINGKNSVQVNILSNTTSGVVPIEVFSEFKDANNNDRNLTKVFNVVVLSGPPTAMSLSYASTEQNSETAKFVENWVLTVTDKYNNLVNSTPSISMGALVGYADSSAATSNAANYLYYSSSVGSGALSDANPDTFTASTGAFSNVDLVNDNLVLFGGDGYRFDAFGKWDIDNIAAANQLELIDDYNGSGVTNLGYAVGHNFRNEVCSGNPVVANVYAKDGNNVLPSTGSMIIQVEYDYYLVGKDIVLWTNLVGSSNNSDVRIGLGRKVTLRGQGLESPVFDVSSGYDGIITLPVKISGTVEEYKNANFSYAVKSSVGVTVNNIVASSMSDIYSCGLSTTDALGKVTFHAGQAYVDLNITAIINGTIQLTNILPSNEF